MPRRRTRIAAAENLARGLRGLPPMVVRRGAVVHAVSLTAVVSIESAVALDVSGGVATASGGDVAYRVGQAVRETVDPKGDNGLCGDDGRDGRGRRRLPDRRHGVGRRCRVRGSGGLSA